jgi:hypothetical protein
MKKPLEQLGLGMLRMMELEEEQPSFGGRVVEWRLAAGLT